ncbi:MAG: response regulator [Ferruginibacter sp.]
MKQKLNCILLVDDDEPTNFISNILLEEAGYTSHIQIEESAKKALEYLSKTGHSGNKNPGLCYPELIFLDINMPAMNGWEFLDKYKELKLELHHKTIIIMLTTSINPDDKLKAENIPLVTSFENKPLTGKMIERIITKHFGDGREIEKDKPKPVVSLSPL